MLHKYGYLFAVILLAVMNNLYVNERIPLMKIIISPAKKMNIDTDSISSTSVPTYIEKTEQILSSLKNMHYEELQSLWKCNDKIATENLKRIENMNLTTALTPALLAYDGIQYKYMAPTIFEDKMLSYVNEHLRILSGFYGVLKPLDGVTPYRLEMQAILSIDGNKSLYEYWGNRLYKEVSSDGVILNLASKEYSKCVEKYLSPNDTMITCVFGELINDKVVQRATYAKMARGEMVRYMAENNIKQLEDIKKFDSLDFQFNAKLSSTTQFVFIRKL